MAQLEEELKVTKVILHRKKKCPSELHSIKAFPTMKNRPKPAERKCSNKPKCDDKQLFFGVENKGKPCYSNMEALGKMMKEQDCTSGAENSRPCAEAEPP